MLLQELSLMLLQMVIEMSDIGLSLLGHSVMGASAQSGDVE